MAAQQEQGPDEKLIRRLLPVVDIEIFTPKDNRVLILSDEESKGDFKTDGGVIVAETSIDKIRKSMLTEGTLIAIGAGVADKALQLGMKVFFYRQNSIGGVKCNEKVYMLFGEYSIEAYTQPETQEQKQLRLASKLEPVEA